MNERRRNILARKNAPRLKDCMPEVAKILVGKSRFAEINRQTRANLDAGYTLDDAAEAAYDTVMGHDRPNSPEA